ncbi:MAG: thiamine-phosphate kinase [Pseudomonadota bacterium]
MKFLAKLGEFDLIHQFFSHTTLSPKSSENILLGIGDDAAVIALSHGGSAIISVDTSIADVHFPAHAPAFSIGYRALVVSASDLLAMGVAPQFCTLALSLPKTDENWLQDFSAGFYKACELYGVKLIGGDTTASSILSITVQVMTFQDKSDAWLARSTAQVGDWIGVTGHLGEAAAGLAVWQAGHNFQDADQNIVQVLKAYLEPILPLKFAIGLHDLASACIDVSDGFIQDLNHICQQSQVAVELSIDSLKPSAALQNIPHSMRHPDKITRWQFSGGDDYQLIFTCKPENKSAIENLAQATHTPLTWIGKTQSGNCAHLSASLQNLLQDQTGFQHF